MSARAPDAYSDEVVRAWRGWRFDPDEGLLRPTYFTEDLAWPPCERLDAQCIGEVIWSPDEHGRCPRAGCTCGVWAFDTRAGARDDWLESLDRTPVKKGCVPVYGQVSLWGIVAPYERGFRAEKAYPYEVIVPRTVVPQILQGACTEDWNAEQRRVASRWDPEGAVAVIRSKYAVDARVEDTTT